MRTRWILIAVALSLATGTTCPAQTRTWDGRYDTTNIEVTVVYFVPSDRQALADWRDRVEYFCRRIEQFHAREFQGQSTLRTVVHPEPLRSHATTAELREGDGNSIWRRTLQETDRRLNFAAEKRDTFPILLVLSEINWRPLDDFYRLKPQDGKLVFEGNSSRGEHFPGAASGGARAAYLADRGIGWGLVSADGWRVPYRGSDCVVYHEGCGHTVGLPHPEPANGSVMSLAQYQGWISESWLDKEQKIRLGWEPVDQPHDEQAKLFSAFRAIPEPAVPEPNTPVRLKLDWPAEVTVQSLHVRIQTDVHGPWIEVPQSWDGASPDTARLGTFDRATPVGYRVDATLENGATAELWGYLQIRDEVHTPVQPRTWSEDLIGRSAEAESPKSVSVLSEAEVDLLELADPQTCWTQGDWTTSDGQLLSPKSFGARLQLPYTPPTDYRLTLIVQPLDEPNGLLLGQRSGQNRFATLFGFVRDGRRLSAIENIDDRNVGNESTFDGQLFRKGRMSQVIVTVRKGQVTMSVDGQQIVRWQGSPDRLSLSDYWKTPNEEAIFLGAYDCRYRFYRVTLQPLTD